MEFIATYNSGLKIWIERHDGQVRYCQQYAETLPRELITEVVHLGLLNALALARFDQADWRPNHVDVASAPVDLAEHLPGLADVPVVFNEPQTSIWIDEAALSAPLPAFYDSLATSLDDQQRAVFLAGVPAHDPIGQLEQVVETTISHPCQGLPMMASILGMASRTFQRRLTECGVSYSRIIRTVRFKMAQRLLRDPQLPVSEVARRLGYANLANFIRAFRTWTGVGPSQFRKLHHSEAWIPDC